MTRVIQLLEYEKSTLKDFIKHQVADKRVHEMIAEIDQALQLLQPDVSGQSELLRSYFKWHKEQGFVSHKDCDIDEFLFSNSH